MSTSPAAAAGTFDLAGQTINRMGYGAMRITGKGIWGPPADHDRSIQVLRTAVDLGVNFIDTADSYGPFVSEDLIREALHPYDDVVIATKGGLTRTGPEEWIPVGRPAYLHQCVEMSLRRLDVDTIDLYQLHRIDPEVPAEEQIGKLAELKQAGKIRAIGLSEVSVEELQAAQKEAEIVSVQNLYNLSTRQSQELLNHCDDNAIAFIPWFPIAAAELAEGSGALADVAEETGATPAQVSLAWLLAVSDVMLPIPGTSSPDHLEKNVKAAEVELSEDQVTRLTAMSS